MFGILYYVHIFYSRFITALMQPHQPWNTFRSMYIFIHAYVFMLQKEQTTLLYTSTVEGGLQKWVFGSHLNVTAIYGARTASPNHHHHL